MRQSQKVSLGILPQCLTHKSFCLTFYCSVFTLSPLQPTGKLVINASELTRVQEIGSGQFGVVYLGYLLDKTKVAIKTIREGAMSEEDFIEEAKVLM